MSQDSLLPDELLRHLMAVGQVDVLVGLPTLNNASTIAGVVTAIHHAFAKYFPRDRTVLVNSDGGSDDGTPTLIRDYSMDEAETLSVSHSLRTVHRVTTPYHGLPGKGNALRQIFAAADLTQARAVAVLDPEVASVTPEWIAALIHPVKSEQFDFVAPVYPRHPFDGPLVTQVVRPLMRAAYGWQIREPLVGEFGCSGRFAAHCVEQNVWDSDLARYGIDPWIAGTALSSGFRCCEAPIGPRIHTQPYARPGLQEVFQQVVGSVFSCLDTHASYWLTREGCEPLAMVGSLHSSAAEAPVLDGARLAQSFCTDLKNLQSVLEPILDARTLATLNSLADDDDCSALQYPDDLWISTIYEFLGAYHRGVMRREHVVQALIPLYLGRTGSFLIQYAEADPAVAQAALDSLCLQFELSKPYLLERWNQTSAR